MKELYNNAKEMEERVMGQKKQVSKRDRSISIDMGALKSDVQAVMGERTDELDFSGGAREFAKSVNMLKNISNKNKKQLMGLINRHIKAYVFDILIKTGEIEVVRISKRT